MLLLTSNSLQNCYNIQNYSSVYVRHLKKLNRNKVSVTEHYWICKMDLVCSQQNPYKFSTITLTTCEQKLLKIVTEAGFGQQQNYRTTHLFNSCPASSFIMWYTTKTHLEIVQNNAIKIITTNILRIHITSPYFLFHCRQRTRSKLETFSLFSKAALGWRILFFK